MITLAEIAGAVGGHVFGTAGRVTGVVTDTRAMTPGCLFVALRGERYDGHDFLRTAHSLGAAAALTDRPPEAGWPVCVVVRDTRIALGQLAAYWRRRMTAKVVAVTGSNGKTSVKEMIAQILARSGSVLATEGNLNNDIGMPLTLLRLRAEHRYAVVEMGMNRPGEIAALAAIAAPDVGVVTNAGSAHLAGLGSVQAIAEEKGQVYSALSRQGTAVINADDAFAAYWRGLSGGDVLTYGLQAPADVSATYALDALGSDVVMQASAWSGPLSVRLGLLGRHNVQNALAATAVALSLGVAPSTIAAGLSAVQPIHGRLESGLGYSGSRVIDDTYNANPDSARAALDVLASLPGERWFVLGDMAELGPDSVLLHGVFGAAAAHAGIDHLWTLGALAQHASQSFGAKGRHYDDVETLTQDLRNVMHDQAVVLVKGSRSMRMERVVTALQAQGGRDAAAAL
ncbi:MAG TPA: UDP-N-acetylmuramoyl-tripeptide--D-alanyl-D-alanine ligase [Acidiferrobacter sp.]|nr:UDP-N-acetylmuramoyl-tripeptide--D-alanyl-D-alanine ligase [Acidiferrobacter sp.]